MPIRLHRALLPTVALATVALALHAAPPAVANPQQISIMMDDDQLVYAPDSVQRSTLRSMAALGVTLVRATVLWSVVAHGTRDPRTHRRFDPSNPRSYPHGNFAQYDRLVTDAAQAGIGVYFNVTGPGPPWAMGKTKVKALKKAWMPDAVQFGKFMQALGTRYSGNYPNGPGKAGNLPRMATWSIWNEPNWPTWLAPQSLFNAKLGRVIPYSPILYRRLFYAARRGLDASGHTSDFVMLGETQPLGSGVGKETTPMRPGLFLRELFCVNGGMRRLSGTEASARSCGDFRRHGAMRITAFAHHPYTKSAPPTWVSSNRDSFTLGNIAKLPALLDRIAAATHRLPDKLPIMVTEMGYSTNPPNPFRGVPLQTQSQYINQSDYLAYKQARVFSMTQFLYRDSPPVRTAKKGSRAYWGTFQTGITYLNGVPKPSYQAYALPIWVRRGVDSQGQQQLELWAQVRFRRFATDGDGLVFQFRPPGSLDWQNITGVLPLTGTYGFVDVKAPAAPYLPGGSFRAVWGGPAAPNFAASRELVLP